MRERNREWLQPWEATLPTGDRSAPGSFRSMVRDLHRQARAGRCVPLAMLVEGGFAGQVTVNNIVGGSARFAHLGYWIDQRRAGRGLTPLAVAMTVDHCLRSLGLHRIEVAIRPENTASLRVAEKLGLTPVGYAPRYLHIAGDWRDHKLFAVTAEEVPRGLLTRFLEGAVSS